jgi:hypothetical protein
MPTPEPDRPAAPVAIKVPADVGALLRQESQRRRKMAPRPPVWSIGEIVAELVRAALKPARRAPRK